MWKSKYARDLATFEKTIEGTTTDAHVIDQEVWVFEIDTTKPEDIYTAGSIAKNYFNLSAKDIIGDIHVKNLNEECKHEMGDQARDPTNKKFYPSATKSGLNFGLTQVEKPKALFDNYGSAQRAD
ncbi:MAG: hypothetical protein EOO68_00550 [Moraxellaceae bacterium]|nr:MAG: hypothetical protein EOO68_00550 [Moraxellaceae bacterium]